MNKKQIRDREIAAYTLMALLLLLSGFILYRMDYSRQKSKMLDQNQMKLDFAAEVIRYMDSIQDASRTSFENHQEKNLRFTAMTRAEFSETDGDVQVSFDNDPAEEKNSYLYSEDFQKMAEQTLNGVLILASATDQPAALIWESVSSSDAEISFDSELVSKLIKDRPQTAKAAGFHWLCTYSSHNNDSALLYLTPLRSLIIRSVIRVSLTLVSELIIFVTILTYFFSVLEYSQTHKLTKQQIAQYRPKSLRRTVLMLGLTGALIVFTGTAVFQTLDALHEESIIGAKRISLLFEYVWKNVSERLSDEKDLEEKWYVDHGERIASQIAQDPEAVSREQLQEYCDLFGIDYIMLFDPDGNEILCSADYIGFTMDAGLGENSADFRRLLMGIPFVIHKTSFDPVTELERQFIGVRVPLSGESGSEGYGALIMAIRPNMKSFDEIDILSQFSFLDNENRLYFYADQETGKILFAGDSTLVGKTAMECGLPERSLQDGYTDFAVFNGHNSYVTMVKQAAADFFYVIRSSVLFSSTLPMAFSALVGYLLTSLILGFFCLKGYNADAFEIMIGDEQNEGKKYR